LSYCPAAKAASARDKSSSLVGSSLEQPALVRAARQSPNIKPLYLKPMVAILGATDVAQVGAVVVIIAVQSERVLFQSPGANALLARGTRLFNGDCVAATSAARCRFSSKKSHSVPLLVQKMLLAVRARLRFAGITDNPRDRETRDEISSSACVSGSGRLVCQ